MNSIQEKTEYPAELWERAKSVTDMLLGSRNSAASQYLVAAVVIKAAEYENKQVKVSEIFSKVGALCNISAQTVGTSVNRYIKRHWYSGDAKLQTHIFGKTIKFVRITPGALKYITAVAYYCSNPAYENDAKNSEKLLTNR